MGDTHAHTHNREIENQILEIAELSKNKASFVIFLQRDLFFGELLRLGVPVVPFQAMTSI